MSRNQELNVMHVHNASRFLQAVDTHVIPGDTLIFDFIFFLHPVRAGLWVGGCVRGHMHQRIASTAVCGPGNPVWATG